VASVYDHDLCCTELEEAILMKTDIVYGLPVIDFWVIICVERIYLYCFHNIKYLIMVSTTRAFSLKTHVTYG